MLKLLENFLNSNSFRKGRFDELFSVDFPNEEEREKIFEIHLQKRRKLHKSIDLKELAKKTYKFSGADIEAVVKETIETAFMEDKPNIDTQDLITVINTTQPLSESLKDKINDLKEEIEKGNFKSAS